MRTRRRPGPERSIIVGRGHALNGPNLGRITRAQSHTNPVPPARRPQVERALRERRAAVRRIHAQASERGSTDPRAIVR